MPPAPTAPLPEHWTKEKDSRGRIFYSNHKSHTTTWERPVLSATSSQEMDNDPPPYERPSPVTQNAQIGFTCICPPSIACTPSFTFWVVALLSWVVWVLAVSASVDDRWIENVDSFSAGNDLVLDDCDDNNLTDDFCNLYIAFTSLQFMAVSVVSVSMLLLVIATFRPAAGKYCSVFSLGIAAGTLMALYALFQMLAFVTVVIIEKTENDFGGSIPPIEDPVLGSTFGFAAAAVLLAMLQAGVVLVFARGSGDGPFYKCVHECVGMNTRSMPVSGTSMPQPPRPVARTPAPVASLGSQPPVRSPHVSAAIPSPPFYPEVHVESPVVRPAVLSRASPPAVASPSNRRSVDRPAEQSPLASRIVYPAVPNQAAQSPVATQTVESAVGTPAVRSPVVSPAVQQLKSSQTATPTRIYPVVQSPVANPAVQSRVASSAGEPAVANPDAEPLVTSLAVEPSEANLVVQSPVATSEVQPAVASQAARIPVTNVPVQPPVANPDDERAVASQAVQSAVASAGFQSPVASPTVQPAVASPAVQSSVANSDVDSAVSSHAAQSPVMNPAVQSPVTSPGVERAVMSQAIQSPAASPTSQPAVASAAVQPPEASSAVERAVASPE